MWKAREFGADELCGFGKRGDGAAAAGDEFAGVEGSGIANQCVGRAVAFQVGTNQAGAWFKVQRFTPS